MPGKHGKQLNDNAKSRHDKNLHIEDLRDLRRNARTREERYQALLEYYTETLEGKSEFANSTHAHRPVAAVVEDLCKEMDTWEDDGLPRDYGKGGQHGQGTSGATPQG